ncbi:MAG: hypothetical protein H6993_14015 [Pseudomonadales bacterium]|nr:hypothetical protein [Pseudomonadales bacterium]MCP5185075.1 hypothetical protein [Pseudomonadales bacterium]
MKLSLRDAACNAGKRRRGVIASAGLFSLAALMLAPIIHAATRPDAIAAEPMTVETLGKPGPHWVWTNSMMAPSARLFDADTGRMLGMLTTTGTTNTVATNLPRREIVFPGSYYSRYSHGTRSDVVGIYSLDDLQPIAEVALPDGPPKIANGYPIQHYNSLLDGGRWLAIYNFNPTMSVSLVDVAARSYGGEILTAGCGLVFPAGADAFLQLCNDGTVQRVTVDATGREVSRERTKKFFDSENNPLMDKGARGTERWWFSTFSGELFGVSPALDTVGPWSLHERAEDQGWRPGGRMPLAIHQAGGRLFVLMHEGGEDTHKHPGTEVWVYDMTSRERIRRVQLRAPSPSIQVSQDDEPLLYAVNPDEFALDVYSATSGEHLRTITEVGFGVVLIEPFGSP